MRFSASVAPAGESGTGECRSTEVTRRQAEVLAAALQEQGWHATASRGLIEGADEPCDGVTFSDMTLGVLVFTRGAWVMGDLSSAGSGDAAAALSTLLQLLEERFGWVPTPAEP